MRHPENISEAITFAVQNILAGKWTASPGIIESYDAATKRANVQPAIKSMLEDGSSVEHPLCLNVPVLFPSAGGYCLSVNKLDRGEPVLLIFCRRGISGFKQAFGMANPSGGMMQMDSAVAIAGFGALSISPANGISLQKNDGSVKIDVSDNQVEIKVGSGGAVFKSDKSVTFANGASITAAGNFVSAQLVTLETHKHSPTGTSPVIPS